MLKTPRFQADPISSVVAMARGKTNSVVEFAKGVVLINHFSLDMMIWGQNAPESYMEYPEFPEDSPPAYGVVDSPEQFYSLFGETLTKDERTFCVGMCHIEKDPSNAGNGGGWRWHKWGPYLGKGEPTMEYLDDEPKFQDGVYTFHVYQIEGPKKTFRS